MKAIITQSEPSKRVRSVVYVNSVLNVIANDFAVKNGIYISLFKSKTWLKVCRLVNKMHVASLREIFPDAGSITFSHTAGCQCGCSPGYVIKEERPNCFGRYFWVDIEVSAEEEADFKNKLFSSTLAKEFADEKAAHALKLARPKDTSLSETSLSH